MTSEKISRFLKPTEEKAGINVSYLIILSNPIALQAYKQAKEKEVRYGKPTVQNRRIMRNEPFAHVFQRSRKWAVSEEYSLHVGVFVIYARS